jgi:hypothetical protein
LKADLRRWNEEVFGNVDEEKYPFGSALSF